MNQSHIVLSVLLCLPALPAQQEATTLATLAERAAIVVVANAEQSTDPSPDVHRVQFRRLQTLKGTLDESFAISEPAGRICGAGLHGMQQDSSYLLFLSHDNSTLRLLGGDRGAVRSSQELLAQVTAMLAARTEAERLAVLTMGLSATDNRVRADAGLSLAVATGVERASASDRQRLFAALRTELDAGTIQAGPLVQAACRAEPPAAAEAILPVYLGDQQPALRMLLRSQLQRLPAPTVTTAIGNSWPRTNDARIRAAELLAELPVEQSQPALRAMLAEQPSPHAALIITQAMLRQGVSVASLQGQVPAPVLELARRRSTAPMRRTR